MSSIIKIMDPIVRLATALCVHSEVSQFSSHAHAECEVFFVGVLNGEKRILGLGEKEQHSTEVCYIVVVVFIFHYFLFCLQFLVSI